jgi:outer membrane protein
MRSPIHLLGLSLRCIPLALLLAGGCATYDPALERREHTDSFTNALARLEASGLTHSLSLDDCVRLAMTNNYEVRKADLGRELTRIGRNAAFTSFLPTVAAKAGYSAYAKQPNVMTERDFGSASLEVGMPIFMPSTWFLYAAARQGYAAAGVAAFYVRQGIVLQTSMDYYEVLVQQETVAALESQLQAAIKNTERIVGLAQEGFFQPWEADQARFQVESREAELNRARRQLVVARGELLTRMGLSPTAPIALLGETGTVTAPTNTVNELVLKALEVHPSLALADRQVVIREHAVRQAFCNFLPTLSIFSAGTWTGNDLENHVANWHAGLNGTWTLFNGFANVARYKAAKVERRQGELERESAFLNVMIQVIASEAAVRDAAEAARLRQRAYEVAAAKYADYDAKSREGLLPLSEALDARAVMDLAQVALVRSRYQERIAIASLELAIGTTLVPTESTPEEQP